MTTTLTLTNPELITRVVADVRATPTELELADRLQSAIDEIVDMERTIAELQAKHGEDS